MGEVFRVGTSSGHMGLVVSVRAASAGDDVGGLLLGYSNQQEPISYGSIITGTNCTTSINLGPYASSSVMDVFGGLITSTTQPLRSTQRWMLESPAPSIVSRQSVSESLPTGILTIDSMIPIGRGQRELIIGDRQTGKTSICIDTIINLKHDKVLSVYAPVGQKSVTLLDFYQQLVKRDVHHALAIIATSASTSSVLQYLSVYSATALAEYFMYNYAMPVFIAYDDLSKQATAYRELSLLLRRPPGREAFPGDIFYVHSRLLERSAKLNYYAGSASITAFPIVETLAQDVTAYIPTNLISITDGQIFLSTDLFNQSIKPAIDVGISVTRVGSAAQQPQMKAASGRLKLTLAQFNELEAFSQFADDLGQDTAQALQNGYLLRQLLTTPHPAAPIPLSTQTNLIAASKLKQLYNLSQQSNLYSFKTIFNSIPHFFSHYIHNHTIANSIALLIQHTYYNYKP